MQHFEVLDMFLYRKVDCAWFIPSSFGQAYQVAPGRTIRVASILVVLLCNMDSVFGALVVFSMLQPDFRFDDVPGCFFTTANLLWQLFKNGFPSPI